MQKLDPRVRRTRKLLEDSLRALLAEKPYESISVADISERATVNRATFYAHYADKQDLATKMLKGDLEATLLSRLGCERPMTQESLTDITMAVFEFIEQMRLGCPKMAVELSARIGPTLQEALHEFIHTWLQLDSESLKLFPGVSIETVSTVLSWSIYGGAMSWNKRIRRPAALKAAGELIHLLIGGK